MYTPASTSTYLDIKMPTPPHSNPPPGQSGGHFPFTPKEASLLKEKKAKGIFADLDEDLDTKPPAEAADEVPVKIELISPNPKKPSRRRSTMTSYHSDAIKQSNTLGGKKYKTPDSEAELFEDEFELVTDLDL